MVQIITYIIIIILCIKCAVLNFMAGNVFSAILIIICWIMCLILYIKNGRH